MLLRVGSLQRLGLVVVNGKMLRSPVRMRLVDGTVSEGKFVVFWAFVSKTCRESGTDDFVAALS